MTSRTRNLRRHFGPEDIVDVFVYVTVLNLAAQFVPVVISESFLMSMFTAVMLKIVLEVVLWIKDRVKKRFIRSSKATDKTVGIVLLWIVLAGSKFVVLELEQLFFGDAISLGGFFSVTALILAMMAARQGVRLLIIPAGRLDSE